MCTPIYPNTDHPDGREPARTDPVFPFDNCYLWSEANKMGIRVLPRAEGFNWHEAIDLWPSSEYMRWKRLEEEDRIRQLTAQLARQPQSEPAAPATSAPNDPEDGPSSTTSQAREPSYGHVRDSCAPLLVEQSPPIPTSQPHDINDSRVASNVEDDSHSADSESAYSDSIIASVDGPARGTDASGSVDTFTILKRIFSDPHNGPELQPLCHLWFNLAEHIKQDEIPDPVHLFEERDAIVRYAWPERPRIVRTVRLTDLST